METGAAGLALIKTFEGFSSKVYLDIAGYPTVGYGHLIKEGEAFPFGVSESEGEALLKIDLFKAEAAVHKLIKIEVTQNQFDALVSFTFNLGGGALQRSTLRQVVNRGEHSGVREQLIKWCRAGGKVSKGLLRRRNAEADLYES